MFAAGTGILCFVDLVASMIHDKLKLSMNDKNGPNSRSASKANKLLKGSGIGIGDNSTVMTDEDQESFIKPSNNIFGADTF